MFWCIEDPFEVTHNLGRVADKDRSDCLSSFAVLLETKCVLCSLFTMRGEFMRASKMLMQGQSFMSVCERFAPTEVISISFLGVSKIHRSVFAGTSSGQDHQGGSKVVWLCSCLCTHQANKAH